MNICVRRDTNQLSASVEAHPGAYDATPIVREVEISALPLSTPPDCAAVGTTLLYSDAIAGTLSFDQPCSPHVATAIERWFQPSDVTVTSVDLTPSHIAAGDATLDVRLEGVNDDVPLGELPGHRIEFLVLNEGAGSVVSSGRVMLVSNGGLLCDLDASRLQRLRPAVWIAVLFAEDLMVGEIRLPGISQRDDPEGWMKLRTLLDSAGLQLVSSQT